MSEQTDKVLAESKLGNEFFAASFDDGVRAVMESINELDSHGFHGGV